MLLPLTPLSNKDRPTTPTPDVLAPRIAMPVPLDGAAACLLSALMTVTPFSSFRRRILCAVASTGSGRASAAVTRPPRVPSAPATRARRENDRSGARVIGRTSIEAGGRHGVPRSRRTAEVLAGRLGHGQWAAVVHEGRDASRPGARARDAMTVHVKPSRSALR